MFPLKPRDELVFGILSTNTPIAQENIFLNESLFNFDQVCNTTTISFGSSSTTTTVQPRDGTMTSGKDVEMRRVVHRNIERQRRQEMSRLYDSLRSLLPYEHIKGKRSLSDIMHASKDYIKDIEKNVQKLRVRRKNLKKESNSSSAEMTRSNGKGTLRNCVQVNKEQDGIEILITNGSEFRMSSVMIELMSNEMDVVNCVSTKINGRFLHKIHAEASDLRFVDLSRLQERLTCVVNLAG